MHPAKRKLMACQKTKARDIGAPGSFFVVLGFWFTVFLLVSSFWSVFDPVDKNRVIQIITSDFGVFIFSAPIVIIGYVISSGKIRATESGLRATMLISLVAGIGFCYKIDLVPKFISVFLSQIPPLVQNWFIVIAGIVLFVMFLADAFIFKRKSFDSWVEKNFSQ